MNFLSFKRTTLYHFFFCLGFFPFSAYATLGSTDYGYGAISKSLGGSGSAHPADSFASALNPAGLVFVNNQMDIGLEFFNPHRGYTANAISTPFGVAPRSNSSGRPYFFIPNLGYVTHFANGCGAFGIAAYGNGGINTTYPGRDVSGSTIGFDNSVYGGGTAGIDLKQFFLNFGFAYRVHPKLAVGLSVIPAFQSVSVTGFLPFQPFSWAPGSLSNRGNQYSYGLATRFGFLLKPEERFAVAASYQPELRMGTQSKYKGAFSNKGSLNIPSNGIIGVSFIPAPCWTANVDVQRIWYKDEPAYSNRNVCTLDGTSPCIGVEGGAGFGWENITILKMGLAWQANPCWTWRAGYAHVSPTVLSSQTIFNIVAPAVTRDHYTAGFTYEINRRFDLNTNALYSPKETLSGPNQFNPSQRIKIYMGQYELGASLTWRLNA